jgi:dihydroxy-acid dehydratase
MADNLKPRSSVITDGPDRAPTRAMLKAVGFTDDDLRRPIIGVANTWIEIGPCNYHLRRLAAKVKEGIRAAGGTPMEFNTVSISDGISMGAEGMKCSLISREVIADSIELVARGNHFDGLVCLSGCDKTNPGVVMALARLDIPGLALYGGSIAPGRLGEKDLRFKMCSKPLAPSQASASTRNNSPPLRMPLAPAPAPAVASLQPTRCRR